jgi:hypothetical protein
VSPREGNSRSEFNCDQVVGVTRFLPLGFFNRVLVHEGPIIYNYGTTFFFGQLLSKWHEHWMNRKNQPKEDDNEKE